MLTILTALIAVMNWSPISLDHLDRDSRMRKGGVLIVVPKNILQQWKDEIETCHSPKLKVLIYRGYPICAWVIVDFVLINQQMVHRLFRATHITTCYNSMSSSPTTRL